MQFPTTPMRASSLGLILCAALAAPAHASKADKDLQAVIALQGKDCGTVTSSERVGSNDYIATCSNGSRYRVSAAANGRVSVTAQ